MLISSNLKFLFFILFNSIFFSNYLLLFSIITLTNFDLHFIIKERNSKFHLYHEVNEGILMLYFKNQIPNFLNPIN